MEIVKAIGGLVDKVQYPGNILFMETWISHLCIAHKLLERRTNLEPIPFTFGSLAPDFGILNEDVLKFDPQAD